MTTASTSGTHSAEGAEERPVSIGVVGRANSGKTSLVMQMTGASRRPVNFPGSSVECVECSGRWSGRDFCLVDLPGVASLDPATRDEHEAIEYLRGNSPLRAADALCVVLDAAKLSVELRLFREVAALGKPTVVALNKLDVARSEGLAIDVEALARALGVRVVVTDGLRGKGIQELKATIDAATKGADAAIAFVPRTDFEPAELADSVSSASATDGGDAPTLTDRIDRVLLHGWLGLPILALVVFGVFEMVFTVAGPFMDWIEAGQEWVAGLVEESLDPGAFRSFLVDGLINGVGSIVIFVPQIALLILCVTLLEATGYMARAAYLLDRVLSRFGLSGRSFVPLASSFACAIPGILATRIIDDERDRLATILVAPLMSCSARLPVYVVLIGAFFPPVWAGVVLFAMYGVGIVTAVVVATLLRKGPLRGGQSMLVMELPVYQPPNWKVVGRSVWSAVVSFFVMAGTIIFATAIIVWVLSYFPRSDAIEKRFESERLVAEELADEDARKTELERLDSAETRAQFEQSYLARLGKTVQPVFAPAGFDWRTTVGVLAAFPARELVVPTWGVLYSVPDVDPGAYDLDALTADTGQGLRTWLQNARDENGKRTFGPLIALSVMVFFALCAQCMATLGAMRRETGGWKWPVVAFGYMTGLAWLAATAVYQIGSLAGLGLAGG